MSISKQYDQDEDENYIQTSPIDEEGTCPYCGAQIYEDEECECVDYQ